MCLDRRVLSPRRLLPFSGARYKNNTGEKQENMSIRCSLCSTAIRAVAATFVVATMAATSAMAAPVTFAQYTSGDQQWTISSSASSTTVSSTGNVLFSFFNVPGLPFPGQESAVFTLSATSDQLGNCNVGCGPGDGFQQMGYTGTFSFIDAGLNPGANLLSGTFAVTGSPATTGAKFSSNIGSSGGSFNASATAGNLSQLVFTSAYLDFTGVTGLEDASWSLSSLVPNFAINAGRPSGTFSSAGSGTFSSEPGPSAVPEPATFSLIGGALLGVGLLRRKKSSRAA